MVFIKYTLHIIKDHDAVDIIGKYYYRKDFLRPHSVYC